MTDKTLIDTNVLVYAYDHSDPVKQQTALTLLDSLVTSGSGLISTQIISEFFVTVTRKIPDRLTVEQAEERVVNFCQIWPVLQISEMIVLEAIRGVRVHCFSCWDALVWATARLNQAGLILSEDFSHEQIVEGVRFINPFMIGNL
ncbi:MAG: PIN domain-containing protein [Dethiobacter sp.]|jgi:predicted nucleic acid-binding protein|nr:PIN domain-containing protein [Dethiobacter sp.]